MNNFVTNEDANRGFEFQLINDAGEKIDWHITVMGVDSDAYRAKLNLQKRRNIVDVNRTKSAIQSMSRQDSDVIELLVAATISWRGKDAMAEFSAQEAERIYTTFLQIQAQVARAIDERANFLPKAATSS